MFIPYLRINPCWLEHTRQRRPPLPNLFGCELIKALEPMVTENGGAHETKPQKIKAASMPTTAPNMHEMTVGQVSHKTADNSRNNYRRVVVMCQNYTRNVIPHVDRDRASDLVMLV